MEPRETGTAQVESLSSYLVRFAGLQVLPTAIVATRHFAGQLASVSYAGGRNLYGARGSWMNGMGRWARESVARLEELTARDDLSGLTTLPWRGVLSPSGLTANVRRWCPECYWDMRARHGECWDPLSWFLLPVTYCPIHVRPLVMRCRECGVVQPWLPHDTTIGWCAVCGMDLAARNVTDSHVTVRPYEEWMAHACGSLCTAGSQAVYRPQLVVTRDDFSDVIRRLVQKCDSGNRSAFSRRVGVSVHTPSRWIRTGTIRIDSLLQLCMRLGLDPVDLLLRGRKIHSRPMAIRELPSRRRRSEINWDRVAMEFDAILCGPELPSLRDVARTLGVRVNSLRKRLPEKIDKLRQRSSTS